MVQGDFRSMILSGNILGKGRAVFALVLVLLLGWFLVRGMGLYPDLFADEYLYSRFSRLMPLAQREVPAYAYILLYRATNLCGQGYLECARALNALVYVLSAPFIYGVARRLVGPKTSAALMILAILCPFSFYTTFFIPESLLFLCFWAFAFAALGLDARSSAKSWILVALLYVLMLFVKPRAILMLPAVGAYGFFVLRGAFSGFKLIQRRSFLAVAAFAIVLAGFQIAAQSGYVLWKMPEVHKNLLADFFNTKIGSAAFIEDVLKNVKLHLDALIFVFSVPLLMLASGFACWRDQSEEFKKLLVFTCTLIFSMLIVVALFTISTAGAAPDELANRVHARYYGFCFPLLLISSAAVVIRKSSLGYAWKLLTGTLVISLLVLSLNDSFAAISVRLADFPELKALELNRYLLLTYGFVSIVAVSVFIVDPMRSAKFFLFLVFPVFLIWSNVVLTSDLRRQALPSVPDRAGLTAKYLLSARELESLVVVGPNLAALYKVLFHLDNLNVTYAHINGRQMDGGGTILPPAKWLLYLEGAIPSELTGEPVVSNKFFVLLKVNGVRDVDFGRGFPQMDVSSVEGLSAAELGYTWSDADRVIFNFAKPLPKHFVLRWQAKAFARNVESPIGVRACDGPEQIVMFAADFAVNTLDLKTDGRCAKLKISVPYPTSPTEAGVGADKRRLGLAFRRLEVFPRPD